MAHRLIDIRSPKALLGCAAAAGLLVAGAGPASAERFESSDATGDMTAFTEDSGGVTTTPAPGHHAGDVTSVVVRHRRHAVTLEFTFVQLRRAHVNALVAKLRTDTMTRQLFVDDEPDARPRLYVFDKHLRSVCKGATLHVDYQANTVATRVPRTCLGRPDWVRAQAISADDKADGTNTFYLDDAFSPTPEDDEGRATWSPRVSRR